MVFTVGLFKQITKIFLSENTSCPMHYQEINFITAFLLLFLFVPNIVGIKFWSLYAAHCLIITLTLIEDRVGNNSV